ncbi:hypothetical protein PZB75_00345 [Streptomyces sp. AM 4-1-1]|uniref:hypothetical protein n=1 Tax=Streptomyces sp. AM 4-1-1 TaxID=3028710 RepID=UPI0023B9CEF2|nr:hypothetical protein [Streptomyces sp. AM 4-1-1]WEH31966.1 hypothetical protein PZB75_00345 [Streptomyces sp. AM 4-1-1]
MQRWRHTWAEGGPRSLRSQEQLDTSPIAVVMMGMPVTLRHCGHGQGLAQPDQLSAQARRLSRPHLNLNINSRDTRSPSSPAARSATCGPAGTTALVPPCTVLLHPRRHRPVVGSRAHLAAVVHPPRLAPDLGPVTRPLLKWPTRAQPGIGPTACSAGDSAYRNAGRRA